MCLKRHMGTANVPILPTHLALAARFRALAAKLTPTQNDYTTTPHNIAHNPICMTTTTTVGTGTGEANAGKSIDSKSLMTPKGQHRVVEAMRWQALLYEYMPHEVAAFAAETSSGI